MSFIWLAMLFSLLGVRPIDYPWLVRALEIHYAPFRAVLSLIMPASAWVFGWEVGFIWLVPAVACIVSAVCSSGLWWVLASGLERRSKVTDAGSTA